MRFTAATAVSMLATSVAARRWKGYGGNNGGNNNVVIEYVTVTAEVVTEYANAAPTTLVTKVAPASSSSVVVAVAATTTAASSSSGSSSGLTADQQAGLDAHNAARKAVNVPDLEWDSGLANDAQGWADHLASIGSLTHSDGTGQGENLYMQSNEDNAWVNAVNAFVSEKSLYNGEAISSTNYHGFGHYTQVVWKSTTKVGMAVARGSSGTYVVCRYSPPGNYIGQTPY